MRNKKGTNQGFTLVELLVAMGLASILLGAILYTFKSQQDSYVVQSMVTRAQQNVRAAIYMISRDIQMAGYYTNFDKGTYSMNWDDLGGAESARPLIYARDNLTGGSDGIQDNTDLIVIVKASQEASDGNQFVTGEAASGSTASATRRTEGNRPPDTTPRPPPLA